MSITAATSSTSAIAASKYAGPVIDMDVHETFTSWQDLVPYLKEPWRRLVELEAWNGLTSPFAYWASHGLNRADSHPASGAPAGSSYELFRGFLDIFSVPACLNGTVTS
jgi:uncharacterized protein